MNRVTMKRSRENWSKLCDIRFVTCQCLQFFLLVLELPPSFSGWSRRCYPPLSKDVTYRWFFLSSGIPWKQCCIAMTVSQYKNIYCCFDFCVCWCILIVLFIQHFEINWVLNKRGEQRCGKDGLFVISCLYNQISSISLLELILHGSCNMTYLSHFFFCCDSVKSRPIRSNTFNMLLWFLYLVAAL